MRVLMLNYEYPPVGGGTGVACQQVVQQFALRPEIEIELVTSGDGAAPTTERIGSGVTIRRLPVGKRDNQFWRPAEIARWTWGASRACRELIETGHYDVCHAWGGWPSGIPAYLMRRRVPYVVALRGSDVPGYNRRLDLLDAVLFRRVSRAVWRWAHSVMSVSASLSDLAHETLPGLPVEIIPNGVDTTRFTPGSDEHPAVVLFVGRLIERKGLPQLLAAFRGVRAIHERAELLIVGDGPERPALEDLALQYGCSDCVTFTGQLDHEKLPTVYREAGLFVLPSRREGMSNAMLEAMAAGLPIVSTREASADLIQGNGLLVPWGDPAPLQAAIVRYLSDSALRREHGRRSRELAESMSWSRVADWYQRFYASAARGA